MARAPQMGNRPLDGDLARGGAQSSPPEVGIKEIFGSLRRRRAVVFSIAALGALAATLVGLQVTPKYTAKALILVDPSGVQRSEQGTIETQTRLIVSRDRLQRIVEQLDLPADPEFNPPHGEAAASPEGWIEDVLGRVIAAARDVWPITPGLAGGELPAALSSPDPGTPDDAVVDAVASRLDASPEGRSMVIGLTFSSIDAKKAVRIVNTVAKTYVRDRLEAKQAATERESVWLDQRLNQLRDELQRADSAVQQFKIDNNLVETGGGSLKEQELVSVNSELTSARAELAVKQAKLDLVRHESGRLDSMPEVVGSALITNLRVQQTELLRQAAELRSEYGDKHPKVIALGEQLTKLQANIAGEIQRTVLGYDSDVQVTSQRVNRLERRVGELTSEVEHDRTLNVTLSDLERRAQATHDLYSSYLRRLEDSRAEQIDEPDVQIVSLADPPEAPDTPSPIVFGAIGFTASLGFGALMALLLERLDNRLRSSGDVERRFGLRTLAAVPRLGRFQRRQPHRYLIAKPLSVFAESVRSVYEYLQRSGFIGDGRVVLITSSVADEGKSTLATSLAAFSAYSGRRTLLLELDLRVPCLNRVLRTTPRIGVVECLRGDAKVEDAIGQDEAGFDYLLVRQCGPDSIELLGSPRCTALMVGLRRRYDLIVMDSAPLLGLTDTKVAARLADVALLAIRWARTDAEICRQCLLDLEDTGISIAGVVLTQAGRRSHASDGRVLASPKYHKLHVKYFKN